MPKLQKFKGSTQRTTTSEWASMVNEGDLILDAPYQRDSVWSTEQQVELVKSIITGVPVPGIVLNDREGVYVAVGGRQRLEAVAKWHNGELAVPADWFHHNELTESAQWRTTVTIDDLTKATRTTLRLEMVLAAHIARIPAEEEPALFLTLNTAGVPQTAETLGNAADHASRD